MKKKELKGIASKIAKAEFIIQNNTNKKLINDAKNKIIEISNSYNLSLEDVAIIDEMVQDILNKQNS